MSFTHLHVHSAFSLLDGASHAAELTGRAAELGMGALAVTDHNTLAGAVRFFKAAKASGIKPIIGVEFTVELAGAARLPALGPVRGGDDRLPLASRPDTTVDYTRYAHLTLLARNNEGYRNLCRLVTCARLRQAQHSGPFSQEFRSIDRKKPVLSQEHLAQYSADLICLSGCDKGEIPRLLSVGKWREALVVADTYHQLFGDENFYIELQNHLLAPPASGLRYKLQSLAEWLGLPIVATNNVHYAERDRAQTQDILVCIRALQTVNEYHPDRKVNAEYALKPEHEMRRLFHDQPRALRSTEEIAERCHWELDLKTFHFPKFDLRTVGQYDEAQADTPPVADRVGRALQPDSAVPAADRVGRALHSGYAGSGQAPIHVASPPQPPSPLLRQTAGGDGRRGENGSTSTVPEVGMAKCGPNAFMHNVSLQPDSAVPADDRVGRALGPDSATAPLSSPWPAPLPHEDTSAYLRRLCTTRAGQLYPCSEQGELPPAVTGRIEHELSVINSQGLCDYFLIVWDICRFSRSRGIMTTGRGSAGDSIVSYLLALTSVDPLAHDLLFERFLNSERRQMPDIDVDFDSRRRDEVTAYVYRRYGAQRVAAVCTVNTFRARSAIREVGAALGLDKDELGVIAESLPHISASAIAEAAQRFPEVRGARIDLGNKALLLELCRQVSGLPRHLSVHVGGLVIGAEPLTNVLSLCLAQKGIVIAEFDKDDIEDLGMVKMDILGLRTHTAISDCLDLIQERTGESIDLETLALDDEPTFELLRATQTIGLFQLESPGQRNLLGRAQPREFEEVIANISLFRPGPVQSDMIRPYIRRKHGLEPVTYLHPALERIYGRTFGVLIYQEQVLEIAAAIAGFTLGEADQLRRAMTSDRSRDEMMSMADTFVEKAVQRGVERAVAEEVFRQVSGFAAYGFCKAHAACFAKISYQTAWLKRHYPAEFLAGILSAQPMGFYPPRTVAEEAKRLGSRILPPCVNASDHRFTVEGRDIRVGLRLLRGMSETAMRSILGAREDGGPFESLRDFCRRTTVPRPIVENLILSRAFAFTGQSEQQLLWLLSALPRGMVPHADVGRDAVCRLEGPNGPVIGGAGFPARESLAVGHDAFARPGGIQPTLDYEDDQAFLDQLPDFDPTTAVGRVALDLKLIYVSTTVNPFSFWRKRMQELGVVPTTALHNYKDGDIVRVAGIVVARARPPTRSGKTAIFISLEDEFGLVDTAVFEETYQRCGHALYSSPVLCIEGKLTREGTLDLSVTAQNVIGMGSWRDFARRQRPNHLGQGVMHNRTMEAWEPGANPKVGERRG